MELNLKNRITTLVKLLRHADNSVASGNTLLQSQFDRNKDVLVELREEAINAGALKEYLELADGYDSDAERDLQLYSLGSSPESSAVGLPAVDPIAIIHAPLQAKRSFDDQEDQHLVGASVDPGSLCLIYPAVTLKPKPVVPVPSTDKKTRPVKRQRQLPSKPTGTALKDTAVTPGPVKSTEQPNQHVTVEPLTQAPPTIEQPKEPGAVKSSTQAIPAIEPSKVNQAEPKMDVDEKGKPSVQDVAKILPPQVIDPVEDSMDVDEKDCPQKPIEASLPTQVNDPVENGMDIDQMTGVSIIDQPADPKKPIEASQLSNAQVIIKPSVQPVPKFGTYTDVVVVSPPADPKKPIEASQASQPPVAKGRKGKRGTPPGIPATATMIKEDNEPMTLVSVEDEEQYASQPRKRKAKVAPDEDSESADGGRVVDKRMHWWENLTSQEREAHQIKGERAIDLHIIKGTAIPAHIRHYIRTIPDYLPGSVTISQRISRLILTSSAGNMMCRTHLYVAKGPKSSEPKANYRSYLVTGYVAPRMVATTSNQVIECAPNTFHCGCSEEAALMELIMFKTLTVRAIIKGKVVRESMHAMSIDPRDLLFWTKGRFMASRLELDDYYARDNDHVFRASIGSTHEIWMVEQQIERLVAEKEALLEGLREENDQLREAKSNAE
ncbi:hypothetical protein C8J56DRAFT_893621 [Mycena floridula]|nr:hypothetical protein C8J56DRAFT_893621 [Mycena floridula]